MEDVETPELMEAQDLLDHQDQLYVNYFNPQFMYFDKNLHTPKSSHSIHFIMIIFISDLSGTKKAFHKCNYTYLRRAQIVQESHFKLCKMEEEMELYILKLKMSKQSSFSYNKVSFKNPLSSK